MEEGETVAQAAARFTFSSRINQKRFDLFLGQVEWFWGKTGGRGNSSASSCKVHIYRTSRKNQNNNEIYIYCFVYDAIHETPLFRRVRCL